MLKFANRSRTALHWVVVVLLVGVCSWVFLRDRGYIGRRGVQFNEEVRARGRLKLLGRLGDLPAEEFQRSLVDLLEREKAAKVSSFYLLYQGIGLAVPGGALTAGVSCPRPLSFPPCVLTIEYGTRNSARTIQRTLVERFSLDDAQLVMYGEGSGLLVLVRGTLPDSSVPAGYGEHFAAVYYLEAPRWEPVVLMDTEQLGKRPWVAGATVGGGSVFVTGHGDRHLWRVDTESHSIQQIVSGARYVPSTLIPSPDEVFLVGGWPPFVTHTRWTRVEVGLSLIDCRDGSWHRLTWRDHGNYADFPLAWSADVPGRVYFLTFCRNLWRLDIDLSQELPESAPQRR